jgi:hypothetical protein
VGFEDYPGVLAPLFTPILAPLAVPQRDPDETAPNPHDEPPHGAPKQRGQADVALCQEPEHTLPRRATTAATLSHSLSHDLMLILPPAGLRYCDDCEAPRGYTHAVLILRKVEGNLDNRRPDD